jgi:50S ribosomal protein L16 3-hydroxylase
LEKLADHLALPIAEELNEEALALLYEWYLAGYIDLPPSGSDETPS